MNKKQKQFLDRQFREAKKKQPEIVTLKRLLLKLGGEFIVTRPQGDAEIPVLLGFGFTFSGPVLYKPMEKSACHQNTAAVWKSKKHSIVGIGTGYALSNDGLWRQHSWGVLRDGVLETTEKRVKYFGFLLQGPGADQFARVNRL